jgi:uncharacterized protein (DUF1501 family)
LLKDTLVLWGGEFGRTPTARGSDGRDHNPEGFTMWMAGGGVKAGSKYGAPMTTAIIQPAKTKYTSMTSATLLHLLGLDHERLTYRYAGRNLRLTDVHGTVVKDIFA